MELIWNSFQTKIVAYLKELRYFNQLSDEQLATIDWYKQQLDCVVYCDHDDRFFVMDGHNKTHLGLTTDRADVSYGRPFEVEQLSGQKVIDFVCSDTHCLALTKLGKVFAWGGNSYGQLGDGTLKSSRVPICVVEADVRQIACAKYNSLAVTTKGKTLFWGLNSAAKKGPSMECRRKPTLLESLKPYRVTQIATGLDHFLVLTDGGRAFTWGSNHQRQLGVVGCPRSRLLTPAEIVMPGGKKTRFQWIACAFRQNVLITKEGRVLSTNIGRGVFDTINVPNFTPQKLYVLNSCTQPESDDCWYVVTSAADDVLVWFAQKATQQPAGAQEEEETVRYRFDASDGISLAQAVKLKCEGYGPLPLVSVVANEVPVDLPDNKEAKDTNEGEEAARKRKASKKHRGPLLVKTLPKKLESKYLHLNDRKTADLMFIFPKQKRFFYAHHAVIVSALNKKAVMFLFGERVADGQAFIVDFYGAPYEVVYRFVRYLYKWDVKLLLLEREYMLELAWLAHEFELNVLLAKLASKLYLEFLKDKPLPDLDANLDVSREELILADLRSWLTKVVKNSKRSRVGHNEKTFAVALYKAYQLWFSKGGKLRSPRPVKFPPQHPLKRACSKTGVHWYASWNFEWEVQFVSNNAHPVWVYNDPDKGKHWAPMFVDGSGKPVWLNMASPWGIQLCMPEVVESDGYLQPRHPVKNLIPKCYFDFNHKLTTRDGNIPKKSAANVIYFVTPPTQPPSVSVPGISWGMPVDLDNIEHSTYLLLRNNPVGPENVRARNPAEAERLRALGGNQFPMGMLFSNDVHLS